jgi:integrase
MALQGPIPVEFGAVFPSGAYAAGSFEKVRDFDRSTGEKLVQQADKNSGLPLWVVEVIDADPDARQRTVKVKVAAEYQPVLPPAQAGSPFTAVGTAADGRLFRTATGGMIYDHTHTWAAARTLGLTPEQVASPLAARPYDLRHGAVSLWLNGGVAVTEVADRAGHSVEILLRVYAKCIDGGEEIANRRIDEALAG